MKFLQDLVPGCSKVGLLELNSLGSVWIYVVFKWKDLTLLVNDKLKFRSDNLIMDFEIQWEFYDDKLEIKNL